MSEHPNISTVEDSIISGNHFFETVKISDSRGRCMSMIIPSERRAVAHMVVGKLAEHQECARG
jgi:hypothetical protein